MVRRNSDQAGKAPGEGSQTVIAGLEANLDHAHLGFHQQPFGMCQPHYPLIAHRGNADLPAKDADKMMAADERDSRHLLQGQRLVRLHSDGFQNSRDRLQMVGIGANFGLSNPCVHDSSSGLVAARPPSLGILRDRQVFSWSRGGTSMPDYQWQPMTKTI